MSDYITKPNNPVANLSNANQSAAVSSRAQTAQAVVRVIVSDISAKQVVLTNPNNQQSVRIATAQFNGTANLKVGQSYALSQQTVSASSSSQTAQSGLYVLTPLLNTARPANILQQNITPNQSVSPQAKQSGSAALSLTNEQAAVLVSSLNKVRANSPVGQVSIDIRANISAINGSQITLTLPTIKTLNDQNIRLNLPSQIVQQLQTGQALNISVQIKNDSVILLSVSLPGQRPDASNVDNRVNSALAQIPSATFGKIPLPILPKELLNTLAKNNADTLLPALNKEFTLNKAVFDALPSALLKTISADLLGLSNTSKLADLELRAVLTKQGGAISLVLQGNQNTVNLNSKQMALLVPGVANTNTDNASAQPLAQSNKTAASAQPDLSNTSNRTGTSAEQQANNTNKNLRSNLYTASGQFTDAKNAVNTLAGEAQKSSIKSNLPTGSDVQSKPDALATAKDATTAKTQASNVFVPSRQLLVDAISLLNSELGIKREQVDVSANTANTPTNKNISRLLESISQLGKQILPKTGSQTQGFNDVLGALNDTQGLSNELQALLTSVKETLPKTDGQPALTDANTIRQLIAAQFNPSPISAITNNAQSGFLSGLVTLLQVSLASRLQKQSNENASKEQQSMPDLLKKLIPNVSPAQSSRFSQEFSQFDTKHTLSAEVSKLLANHQQHKLKSADISIQNQDSLFYSLPNLFSKAGQDIELLIKRENHQEHQQAQSQERQTRWVLNMKFSIGEHGEMLAKTSLQENDIDLQIYTSNEYLRDLVLKKLPFLTERLNQLGINLINKTCQLGKIPATLDTAHYRVFETNA